MTIPKALTPGDVIFVYGGTFDPPHKGHSQIYRSLQAHASSVSRNSRVIVVPAIGHEKKPGSKGNYLYRRQMAKLAFGGHMVPWEEDVLEYRPLPIMSIDVLDHIFGYHTTEDSLQQEPRTPRHYNVRFVIGPDVDTSTWTRGSEIEERGYHLHRVPEFDCPRASAIRDMIALGQNWEQYLIPRVVDYIKLHGLYGVRRAI